MLSLSKIAAAIVATVILSGCSGATSSVAPIASSPQSSIRTPIGGGLFGAQVKSFFACPATGPLKYVSDYNNNVVQVFAGKFAGQAPCGQITSKLNSPWGLWVKPDTHDLYVANDGAKNILVFHRGATKPYNTYTDPSVQDPVDVVVANDGTVIATNFLEANLNEDGSISTWKGGPNGGTFIGNFAMTSGSKGQFVTIRNDGVVYFDRFDGQTSIGSLWFVSCPAGACGAQTQVKGVTLAGPGGLAFDSTGDLRAVEGSTGLADSFELPFTHPRTFPLMGYPTGMAINEVEHHWFVADGINDQAEEFAYPSGALIGIVAANPGGATVGIAVDPERAR
jgi:hypothetical protein